MKNPIDRIKWIRTSLTVLIIAILAFLVLSPVSRASTPEDRPAGQRSSISHSLNHPIHPFTGEAPC